MRQPFAVEERPAFDDRRERIGRLLYAYDAVTSVPQFADAGHPLSEVRTVARPPRLDGPRELRAPQQQGRDGREELVAARLQQIDQHLQLANAPRRGPSVCLDERPVRLKPRRGGGLALDNGEHFGEEVKVMRVRSTLRSPATPAGASAS
jgi:hypothetical protein